MSMSDQRDFYIFRGNCSTVHSSELLRGLAKCLQSATTRSDALNALLRSGELECALADAGLPQAKEMQAITDCCARTVIGGGALSKMLPSFTPPDQLPSELQIAVPEGFAYYALHPLAYVDAVPRLAPADVIVIGIRSIGTSLSAVVAAESLLLGSGVQRFTVRPHGHPFDRETALTEQQQTVVAYGISVKAGFIVVDEGPGLSGSSLLSVAEALATAGVPAHRIVLMPAYAPDPAKLRAPDAAIRWPRFRCVPAAGRARVPSDAGLWLGAGEWRRYFLEKDHPWPAAWPQMERMKFLSNNSRVFSKFEGFGHYGEPPLARAQALAAAGFSPAVLGTEQGFIGYEMLPGRPLQPSDLRESLLHRIAEYCAFRAVAFACNVTQAQAEDLETMLRVNWEREFGNELPSHDARLPVIRPAVADGRMLPHEWIATTDGRILKLDATTHGDDHFFPGPCDIAWDLAGAIVEWEMDAAAQEFLLAAYHEVSEDDPHERIANYLRAYATFRFAWSKMASAAVRDRDEEARLLRDYERYRQYAELFSATRFHTRNQTV